MIDEPGSQSRLAGFGVAESGCLLSIVVVCGICVFSLAAMTFTAIAAMFASVLR